MLLSKHYWLLILIIIIANLYSLLLIFWYKQCANLITNSMRSPRPRCSTILKPFLKRLLNSNFGLLFCQALLFLSLILIDNIDVIFFFISYKALLISWINILIIIIFFIFGICWQLWRGCRLTPLNSVSVDVCFIDSVL